MLHRRKMVTGTTLLACNGLLACEAVPLPRVAAQAGTGARGCCLWGHTAEMGSRSERSGNPRLDDALGETLAEMAALLEVRPGFAFYQDGDLPNAVALPRSDFAASSGTVLFGLTMLSRVDSMAFGDLFVQAVCAHEFAHIRQYQTPFYTRLERPDTVRLVELHADFLAGYYLGRLRREFDADELVSLGRSWETLGDSEFTRRDHHGTREERIAAMEAGFASGRQGVSVDAAAEAGAHYLEI